MLQIGDQNRSYAVRLDCLVVDDVNEDAAKAWLKKAVPRGKRVNLRPVGSSEGVLLARVTPLGSTHDLSEGLTSIGLGKSLCQGEPDNGST